MSLPILQYNKKKKCKLHLASLENKIDELKKNNVILDKKFDLDALYQEVNDVTWGIHKPLCYSLFATKNLISVQDKRTTGGSKILDKYYSPITSTIFNDLKQAGAINVFMSNMDEFAMGGTGLESAYGPVCNPYNNEYMIKGSSSGNGYLVSEKIVDFALGSDTGDSGRAPSSTTNTYGFKPTYGLISRYGFFPFCSSFDAPAIMANDVDTIAQVLSVISHKDPKDLSTINTEPKNYHKSLSKKFSSPIKVGLFKNLFPTSEINEDTPALKKHFYKLLGKLRKDEQIEIKYIEFDRKLLDLCQVLYCIISYSEGISSLFCINGLIFPFAKNKNDKYEPIYTKNKMSFEEILKDTRKNLGTEVKFRHSMGKYFMHEENYESLYIKAKKILTLINQEIDKVFKKYDVIISPTLNKTPTKISDFKPSYSSNTMENILLLANFCGLPAISIPWIFIKKLPIGLHLFSKYKSDEYLLRVVNYLKKNQLV